MTWSMKLFRIPEHLCSGCGLCEGIAGSDKIKMKINELGYLRPESKKGITNELYLKIRSSCPGFNINGDLIKKENYNYIWGNIHSCSVATSQLTDIRNESSSGGVISSILLFLLDRKLVDIVIHIGEDAENPLLNEIKLSSTKEEIINNANSRYGPSAPLIRIKELLNSDKTYAFVGKPCDIAALKQYGLHESLVGERIKYFISFLCAGIPSIHATNKLLKRLHIPKEEVKEIYYRKDGWPGKFKVITKDGSMATLSYKYAWGKVLGKELQFRCKICPDGIGEFSDISCGDAWKSFDEKGFPSFIDDIGQSLVFTRTKKGEELISQIYKSGILERISSIDVLDELIKIQPGQYKRRIILLYRLLGVLISFHKIPRITKNFILKASRQSTLEQKFRAVFGILFRIWKIYFFRVIL